MLSLFPSLLFLSPLSATILRVTAAFVFARLSHLHFTARRDAASEIRPLIGSAARAGIWIYVILELIVASALFLGIWTQLMALIAAVAALKFLLVRRSLRHIAPYSRMTYFLLAMICLSLVFTGAGGFAFDLPL